jgi:hypothetical protein
MSEEKKEDQPIDKSPEEINQNQEKNSLKENNPSQEEIQNENSNQNQNLNQNPQQPPNQEEYHEQDNPQIQQGNQLNQSINKPDNEPINENINQKNENHEEQAKEENQEENDDENNEEEQKIQKEEQKNNKISEKERKKYNKAGIEDIQNEIQEITKKIEQEKINLRITTERLTQKEKTYNELQGKPVNKTNEEKEKERREHKKAVKNHKLSDPIIRKKGKEKEYYDEQIKNQKAYDKSKTDFEKLTCDINELVIGNKDLKQQIIDLRKRKVEAMKQLENIMEENQKSQDELNEILKGNRNLKDQIKYKEYKKVIEFGNVQEKNFVSLRDDYEDQYHELIKEYVKREKEAKKENAKKRQMALLGSGSPTHFKGMNDKDIEKQIKMLAEEEISDRTPILDLAIEKWTEINRSKKITIERHYENCVKIEEAFKKLTNFLGLDNFSELPTVFRKTEQQISNINFYNEKLDLQIDELEQRKESIIQQIKLLSGKQNENTNNKSKFKEQKEQNIKVIENLIINFENDMEHKKEVFRRIQPQTDNFLSKLGDSYLGDFIPNKANIDPEIEYNEQTVNKFLSNVQDYYKIIQKWDEASKVDDNKELDKLREDMKLKLGGFEKNRIISKKLINSMKNDLKKGINIEDIIKKSSLEITSLQNLNTSFVSNPYLNIEKREHNNSSLINNSQMPTEMINNNQSGSGNMSNEIIQNQSNIVYPQNNSSFHQNNNNSSSHQENSKVPEKV